MSGDQLDGPFGGYRGGKPAAEVPPPRTQPSGHPMVTLAERYAEVVKERDALVAEVRRLRAQNDQLAIRLGRRMTGPEIGAAISHGIQTGAIELPAEGERMYSTDEVKAILGLDE